MPGSLSDTSVWIAAVFPRHPLHGPAQDVLFNSTPGDPAVFCRASQQSFLRLLTNPAVAAAYGAERLTTRDALAQLEALLALPRVVERDELPGTAALWHRLASRDTASPKVWMDAYLAAFVITGGLRLVSLDRGYHAYESEGPDLHLIQPQAASG